MTNLDLLVATPPLSAEGREALRRVLAAIEADPTRVVRRFTARLGPFGLLRPSFAIRAHHFRGFVEWLLAAPVEAYAPAESEESAE